MAAKTPRKPEDKWTRLHDSWTKLCMTGSLAQYQVPVKEVGRSSKAPIKKLEHGKREKLYIAEKTILLVGDTGSGKSTMVDALINFVYGVKVTDKFRLRIINPEGTEEAPVSQTKVESQTKWITCYSIHPNQDNILGFTLNIIDTPGFCDTSGIEADRRTVEYMKELFKSPSETYGVDSVSCVCIIMKAVDNRKTAAFTFMIDETLNLFGRDLENNITVLATHDAGDTKLPQLLQDLNVPEKRCFIVNNAWLVKRQPLSDIYYTDFNKECKELFDFILHQGSHSLNQSAKVLEMRTELEDTTQTLIDLLNNHAADIVMLENTQKNLKAEKTRIVKVLETEWVKNSSLTQNRLCSKCHLTCERNVGRLRLFIDRVFKETKTCPICECPLSEHSVDKTEFALQQIYKDYPYEDFMKMQGNTCEIQAVLHDVDKKITAKKQKLEVPLGKLRICSESLRKIALRPNLQRESLGEYVDLVIEQVRRLNTYDVAEVRIRELQKLKADKDLEMRLTTQKVTTDILVQEYGELSTEQESTIYKR